MSERTKQVLWNYIAGFVLVEIPVVTAELALPSFDYKHLAIGLLGGLAASLNRYIQTRPEGLADLHREAEMSLIEKDTIKPS